MATLGVFGWISWMPEGPSLWISQPDSSSVWSSDLVGTVGLLMSMGLFPGDGCDCSRGGGGFEKGNAFNPVCVAGDRGGAVRN